MGQGGSGTPTRTILTVILLLVAAVVATTALLLTSGVLTPREPAEAALGWADRLVGVEAPDQRTRTRRERPRRSGRRLYRVRAGDTLGHVSRRTGVSVRELKALNSGLDELTLQRGRLLRLGR